MDAKRKANFINAIATGEAMPCPKCGTNNKADSKFCASCGAELAAPQDYTENTLSFEPAKESPTGTKAVKYVEPSTVFAQGLPEWSIEQPPVLVRRH